MRQCLARFVSLGPGQREAIVFIDGLSIGYLFEQDAGGHWKRAAKLQGNFSCNGAREEIENGAIALQPHTWPDIVVGSHRIEINSLLGMCGSPW